MAYLFYANLFDQPDIVLEKTYDNLGEFFKYLKTVREHLNHARPLLPWRLAGVLVELLPPPAEEKRFRAGTWQERLRWFLSQPGLRAQQGETTLDIWERAPQAGLLLLINRPQGAELVLRAGEREQRCQVRLARPHQDGSLWEKLGGVWIELGSGREDEEAPLRAFLDEEIEFVYEVPEAQAEEEDDDEGGTEEDDDAEAQPPSQNTPRQHYRPDLRIQVLDQDEERQALRLDRLPRTGRICVKPNTYVVQRQLEAVQRLQDAPAQGHRALLNLFQRQDTVSWRPFSAAEIPEDGWFALRDPRRPGTEEQRDFVRKALRCPDFMLLEGPPGSGKTTAIVELILQLCAQPDYQDGRPVRILLCASTHVAVDNVIEKLKDARQAYKDQVLVLRIGDERKVHSELVRPYCLSRMAKSESQDLVRQLKARPQRSPAQEELLRVLDHPDGHKHWEQTLLACAQVVCGTTIGILKHPDIKERRALEPFDLLILDEASKTPFTEFLVPALWARRWVIVGDRRQLSPYVEEAWLRSNLASTLPDNDLPPGRAGEVCRDVFHSKNDRDGRALIVGSDSEAVRGAYVEQSQALLPEDAVVELPAGGAIDPYTLSGASVVVAPPAQLDLWRDALPPRTHTVRLSAGSNDALRRCHRAFVARTRHGRRAPAGDDDQSWAGAMAWRLVREYELRLLPDLLGDEDLTGRAHGEDPLQRLAREREELLPRFGEGPDRARAAVEGVRRVALPSILESLQHGLGRGRYGAGDNALCLGLPERALADRLVSLTHQHRMHPDISSFPRQHIYLGRLLRDPPDMAERRRWDCPLYPTRSMWIDVDGKEEQKPIRNVAEADVLLRDLARFYDWARGNPKLDPDYGPQPWEVAVLTFHRGQEAELRDRLRRFTGQAGAFHQFHKRDGGRAVLDISLCTVDRFQGHEADLVLLSFVLTWRTGFLNSPNRLNVALTRARYQLVLIGKRVFWKGGRHQAPLLTSLAQQVPGDHDLEVRT